MAGIARSKERRAVRIVDNIKPRYSMQVCVCYLLFCWKRMFLLNCRRGIFSVWVSLLIIYLFYKYELFIVIYYR